MNQLQASESRQPRAGARHGRWLVPEAPGGLGRAEVPAVRGAPEVPGALVARDFANPGAGDDTHARWTGDHARNARGAWVVGSGSVGGDAPLLADGSTAETSGEPWGASKHSGSSVFETAGGGAPEPFPAAGLGPRLPESPEGGAAAPPEDEPTGSSAQWRSEAVLERGLWRERPPEPWASQGAPAALEREDAPRLGHRIKRAVTVPVLAGAVVLVVAVLIAIAVAALQPGGAGVELARADAGAEGRGGDSAESGSEAAASGSPNAGGGSDSVAGGGAGGGGAGDTAAQRILVHVVGEVARPGVIEVVSGARVGEAIEAAGGASEAAVLSAVNLARTVVDGEQIVVPNAQQVQDGAVPGAPAAGNGGAGAAGGVPAVIDLNTADAGALETLPRVGPALAQRILDWRSANGRFASVDQLLEVPGIGAKILDGMRERVRV